MTAHPPIRRYGWPPAQTLLDRCQRAEIAITNTSGVSLSGIRALFASGVAASLSGQQVRVRVIDAKTEADLDQQIEREIRAAVSMYGLAPEDLLVGLSELHTEPTAVYRFFALTAC